MRPQVVTQTAPTGRMPLTIAARSRRVVEIMSELSLAVCAVAVFVLGTAAVWLLSCKLAGRDSSLLGGAIAAVVVVALWWYTMWQPQIGLRLVPWDDYLFFERIPMFLGGMMLLMLSFDRLCGSRRVLIGVLGVVFVMYSLTQAAAPLIGVLYTPRLDDTVTGTPEVMQSTGWSCSAAALAWALRLNGQPVSESQVARLALTNPIYGTQQRGVFRAAHRLGWETVLIRKPTWQQLVAAPKPLLASVWLCPTIYHEVVIIAADQEHVTVGDPMLGESDFTREEFVRKWRGDLVLLQRTATPAR